ncbi:hypothetical protein [Xylophilus sp. GOD-11R]|uniref:hypothetical protein n=1 Tax=Xylophilus sp. GOD-11R TaxID=3089814 RepID=UPI00298D45F9|nr:hypothetical protein [Xylophilus sp. GOD-11R]WPB58732.1 hypothetical protein R9X41_08865 [Xylophilus sp. GOD-11R]
MQDEAIVRVTEESLRLSRMTEARRLKPSLVDRQWFPWVAMPAAMAFGATIAISLSR